MTLRMTNDELRERLARRRAELRERTQRIGADLRREADPPSPDAPDLAVQRANDDVLRALADAANTEIAHIDAALAAIESAGAVLCGSCGTPIEPARLAVVPEARRCERCMERELTSSAEDLDLEDGFRECDEDADGAITLPEFRRLLGRCGSTLTAERQRAEFDGIDRNRDGRIDWNEFKVWWKAR